MNDTFNPNHWEFERSSGVEGRRNTKTQEWVPEVFYRNMVNEYNENILWEKHVFRIIKLHTLSNNMTEKIVNELKKVIHIHGK